MFVLFSLLPTHYGYGRGVGMVVFGKEAKADSFDPILLRASVPDHCTSNTSSLILRGEILDPRLIYPI